jgi:hypothetical protein
MPAQPQPKVPQAPASGGDKQQQQQQQQQQQGGSLPDLQSPELEKLDAWQGGVNLPSAKVPADQEPEQQQQQQQQQHGDSLPDLQLPDLEKPDAWEEQADSPSAKLPAGQAPEQQQQQQQQSALGGQPQADPTQNLDGPKAHDSTQQQQQQQEQDDIDPAFGDGHGGTKDEWQLPGFGKYGSYGYIPKSQNYTHQEQQQQPGFDPAFGDGHGNAKDGQQPPGSGKYGSPGSMPTSQNSTQQKQQQKQVDVDPAFGDGQGNAKQKPPRKFGDDGYDSYGDLPSQPPKKKAESVIDDEEFPDPTALQPGADYRGNGTAKLPGYGYWPYKPPGDSDVAEDDKTDYGWPVAGGSPSTERRFGDPNPFEGSKVVNGERLMRFWVT